MFRQILIITRHKQTHTRQRHSHPYSRSASKRAKSDKINQSITSGPTDRPTHKSNIHGTVANFRTKVTVPGWTRATDGSQHPRWKRRGSSSGPTWAWGCRYHQYLETCIRSRATGHRHKACPQPKKNCNTNTNKSSSTKA